MKRLRCWKPVPAGPFLLNAPNMHRLQFLAALAFIAVGGATSTQANMVVGNVVLIQQDVEGAFNDQDWTQTSKGDDVIEAEFIRAQVNSRANFALLDGPWRATTWRPPLFA